MATPDKSYRYALPPGRELDSYRLGDVLGQGAFGITYLARDMHLGRRVALKEYFPGHIAIRDEASQVQPLSHERADEYAWGLGRFVHEAQTLAKFEHPSIVRVHHVFKANNTAYMVMQYEQGCSLESVLKHQGTLDEDEILRLTMPLLSGLEMIHAAGFVHRDVKPANIFLRRDRTPVLLDFGSARQARPDEDRTLTKLVSPGYAPIEQYTGKSDKQGPWTDVYGLGATLYRAVTGQAPVDAVARGEALAHDATDAFEPGVERARGRYRAELLQAIDHALEFRIQDRPQSIADWRREFDVAARARAGRRGVGARPSSASDTVRTEPITMPLSLGSGQRPDVDIPKTIELKPRPAVATAVDRRLRSTAAMAGLTVLLGTGAVMYFNPPDDARGGAAPDARFEVPEPPGKDRGQPDQNGPPERGAAGPASAQTEGAGSPDEPGAGPALEQRIDELLRQAAADMAALKLTTPPGDSAYDRYRAVLALDPANRAARRGIESISARYVQLAHRDIEAERFDRAGSYLDKADALAPGDASVRQAREALLARRDPPAPSAGRSLADKVEGLGRRVEKLWQADGEPAHETTRGDAFLRQLKR